MDREHQRPICTITLEMLDFSPLQVADAICKCYKNAREYHQEYIIEIDEVQKHLKAYVDAQREIRKLLDGE